jgi:putative Holliday junction resolvase
LGAVIGTVVHPGEMAKSGSLSEPPAKYSGESALLLTRECPPVNDRIVNSQEKKLKHRADAHWQDAAHAVGGDSPGLEQHTDAPYAQDEGRFSARPARILALDVGSKRIGVAVTDAMGITAQGLDTIQRQNKRLDMEALKQVLEKYEIREIVIGLPLRLSGAEGTQSEKMRAYAAELHAHFGLTVHLWDERWTSTEANRLLRETDLSIKKRGQAVDRMAAILILQSWMQAHPGR